MAYKSARITYTLKMPPDVIQTVRKFCGSHGLKIGYFIQEALKEKIEKEEYYYDLKDFDTFAHEENQAINYDKFLKQLTK